MPDRFDPTSQLNHLPADFYDKLSPCLNLCGMACLQLFSRPDDPLPQEITDLTGLDRSETRLITAINSADTLGRQFLEAPEMLYDYLLVGRLTLESPLAEPVLRYVQKSLRLDDEQLAELHRHVLDFGGQMLTLIQNYVAAGEPQVSAELQQHRQEIEELFERLGDTLTVVDVPHHSDPGPSPTEPVLEIGFLEPQLLMLRLAVHMLNLLPDVSDHPFARAVGQLSTAQPEALQLIATRLQQARPEEELLLTLPEVSLLYQAAQVLVMALLSNVLDPLQWQEAMLSGAEETAEAQVAGEEEFSRRQEVICTMIRGFVEFVQREFDDEPGIAAIRQETEKLADLL